MVDALPQSDTPSVTDGPQCAYVDLIWIPLGAGGHSVRYNGVVYEAAVALLERRARCDLYHSALEVAMPPQTYSIEMTPVPDANGVERGVVAQGSVGSRLAGRLRLFRYEVRCWPGGEIPDRDWSIESPRRVTDDPVLARRVLDLVPQVPTYVWGRDELGAGEMWNSNSLVSWLLVSSGVGIDGAHLPEGGRAPGWNAGLVAARRA